jgi:hypothetical protein
MLPSGSVSCFYEQFVHPFFIYHLANVSVDAVAVSQKEFNHT